MNPALRSVFVAVPCLLLAACATVQPTQSVGPNDPAALAAIRAAYVKASEQKSFRGRMRTESDGKVSESTIEFAARAGWVKLWVGANGLPLKVESEGTGRMLGFSSKSKTTIFYEDYGAPVRIVAPM